MFRFLAWHTHRSRWAFIVCGALVLLCGIVYGTHVFDELKSGGLLDPRCGSSREAEQAARLFPRLRTSVVVLVRGGGLDANRPAFRRDYQQIAAYLRSDPSHPAVTSYYDGHDPHLVSRDRREAIILASIPGSDDQQEAVYERMRQHVPRTRLTALFGGPAVVNAEVDDQVQVDLGKAGMISMPLLAVLLLIIFRSVIAALLPLVIGAISALGAFALTRVIASFHVDISVFAAQIIGLLGLGLAIDYSLLFVSRFRDELDAGKNIARAVAVCVLTAGRSIFLSGSTVAVSLLALLLFPEMFLRSMGLGGALAVLMAMATSLTVLPAILSVAGPWVNRLALPLPWSHHASAVAGHRIWRAIGLFTVRHPGVIIAVTLVLLLAGGLPFLHTRFAGSGASSLPPSFQARAVALAIERDFPGANQEPPIEILVTFRDRPTAPANLRALTLYVALIQSLSGARDARSLATLSPDIPQPAYPHLYASPTSKPVKSALKNLAHGDTTLITVGYPGTSQGEPAQRLVADIRSLDPPPGASALVGGDSAELVDRLGSMRTHLPVAALFIVAAIFVLLLAMLGSVVIPLKAIVLNLLSLSAAFGAMTWIFQDGHLRKLLQFTPSGSLDPTIPVLIFAIAFGLATDYEVFLVTRIKEEYDRTRDNAEAILIGVEKTGGIITSAGLLLVVVVAAFGTGAILTMKEMGVGLAIAVAIDAAIVRVLLVPSSMELFGWMNWWAPRPLAGLGRPAETNS